MSNYVSIHNNKEVDALIYALENSCQSSGQSGKKIMTMT